MRRDLILLAAGALALVGLGLAMASGASAATQYVNATGYRFVPENLTVYVGDTVNWTNLDPVGHDVTFEAGFGSGARGALASGASWEYTFTAAGVFKYRCQEHTTGFDPPQVMIGRVTVLDSANGPSVSITSGPGATVAPNATITFSGVATDNASVASVRYTVDGGPTQSVSPTPEFGNDTRVVRFSFSGSASALAPGNHTVRVWAFNGTDNGTALAITFEVLGAAPPGAPLSPPATWNVDLLNFAFNPQVLEIGTGDTVVFTNRDPFGHDVTFDAGFGSGAIGALSSGQTWSYTFNTTGTFHYRCQAHPPNMVGDIIVYDRALRPALEVTEGPPARVAPATSFTLLGYAQDAGGVTGVFVQVDAGAPAAVPFSEVTAGDARNVSWNYTVPGLVAGTHTVQVFSTNGAYNSTVYTVTFQVAAAAPPPTPPPGNPFGETFVFEDILSKYFWLIVGVTVILTAVVMMFLSYSGKLQNYYIVLLTALDERHRFFAFARPTREFLYTIQRQMPRTHTERYNLKVIWYWYPLYCLGGLSFAAFIIETITGIVLGFYYIPEGTGPNEGLPSAAYQSMETIMTKVTFGYIFRALHHWGAHMMVAAVFLHMMRVYFVGAYKNPRELNWFLGVVLLLVTLLFGYTGYLLPWDQLAFWAGQIGLEMAVAIPVIGEIIGNLLFGGPELSGATIIRMYYLHVFVLPLVGGALMVLHMGIVWMQGVAEPH